LANQTGMAASGSGSNSSIANESPRRYRVDRRECIRQRDEPVSAPPRTQVDAAGQMRHRTIGTPHSAAPARGQSVEGRYTGACGMGQCGRFVFGEIRFAAEPVLIREEAQHEVGWSLTITA
jgi:hypothetical protein